MISVYPAFYKDFRCKADRCVHSCCMQNWDIDIDEATAMKYLVMTGEPGKLSVRPWQAQKETAGSS